MIKFAKLLAAAALIAPLAAHAGSENKTFTRDGVTYEYVVTTDGGKTILEGTANGRSPFRLVVSDNKVRGKVKGQYVSFNRPKNTSAETAVLASR